jgi:hypothetical protein
MPLFTLAVENIVCLKRAIRETYPQVKSSHASEAVAFALGFRTHAALRAAIAALGADEHKWAWLDGNKIADRLVSFGYSGISRGAMVKLSDELQMPVTLITFWQSRGRERSHPPYSPPTPNQNWLSQDN